MSILAVLNQKGGSCKTTASTNIAVELARRGKRVLIVDCDPQRSASDWRAARKAEDIVVVSIIKAAALTADVRSLASGYDIVIIDGAAIVGDMTTAAVKLADAILIPTQPTPRDLWGTADLVDVVKARHQANDGKPPAAFLVTRAFAGTKLSRDIDDALLALGLPVLDARIHNRQVYPSVEIVGMGVVEFDPNGEAAREIVAIVDELVKHKFIAKGKK